jgi:hypothetical protein
MRSYPADPNLLIFLEIFLTILYPKSNLENKVWTEKKFY